MKVKLAQIKKLVRTGPVQFITGMLVGAGAILIRYHKDLTLVLKDEDIRELRVNPGSAVYETDCGPIFVTMNDFSEGD